MDNHPEHLFDIEKIKYYLYALPEVNHQIRFLYRVRTNYQQHRDTSLPDDAIPLDEQIDLEINYLGLVANYREQRVHHKKRGLYSDRLRVIGKLKPLALAFRALMRHDGDNGSNYLSTSYIQLAHFLSKVLEDANGQPVNRKTLYDLIIPRSKNKKEESENMKRFDEFNFIDREDYYKYDIEHVKKIIKTMIRYEERILFLHRVLTNHLQHRNPKNYSDGFTNQLELELQQQRRDFDFERLGKKVPVSHENRIQINGRVNVLMTFFYELLVEFPEKYDVECFNNSKGEVIAFVQKYFVRKNGKSFSAHSLRSTLTPSKYEKRCSNDKQVKIKSFWNLE